MRYIILILLFISNFSYAQNFSYGGRVYGINNVGVPNVTIQLWKRVTPTLTGFTSQQNYNGHSYYRSTGVANWTTAKQNCINMSGHLVTVTTAAENSFISGLWPSGWIGLTDEVTEGVWKWVTGETYSYTSWNGGEPNNSGNEDYIQFVGAGKWNDLNNNSSLPYVLEFEYIVTTGDWTLDATATTNSVGDYSFLRVSNPSIEWKLVIDTLSISPPEKINAVDNNGLILSKRSILGKDYFRYDLNIDGIFSISDLYLQLQKKNSASWLMSTYKIITQTENATLQTTTSDLRLSILGSQNYSLNPLTNGGVTNIYIIRTGYEN